MNSPTQCVIVLVTTPDLRTARALTKLALEARLIACANLIPNIESHYWWKGKIDKSSEVLLVMKTRSTVVGDLEKLVMANHPYETPEFVVLNIQAGNEQYLRWVFETVRNAKVERKSAGP